MDEKGTLIVTTNNLNNSNKARREADEQRNEVVKPLEKKELRKVPAKLKKESFWSKLKKAFFGEDVENVGEYMFFDVGIPALKATISDMIGNGIEVLLFGESRGRRDRRDRSNSYASMYRSDRDRRDNSRDRRDDDRDPSYRDVYFETKSDAEDFIAEVYDYVKDYGRISVAVYMSIAGMTSTKWKDDHVGWYKEDVGGLCSVRTRYGYEIDIPRPQKID